MSHRSGIMNGILKLVFAFVIMPLLAVASFLILLPSLPHLVLVSSFRAYSILFVGSGIRSLKLPVMNRSHASSMCRQRMLFFSLGRRCQGTSSRNQSIQCQIGHTYPLRKPDRYNIQSLL